VHGKNAPSKLLCYYYVLALNMKLKIINFFLTTIPDFWWICWHFPDSCRIPWRVCFPDKWSPYEV